MRTSNEIIISRLAGFQCVYPHYSATVRPVKGAPLLSPVTVEAKRHYSRNSDLKSEYTRSRFTRFPNSNLSAPIAARDVRAGPTLSFLRQIEDKRRIVSVLGRLGESLATLLLVQGGNDRSYGRAPYADIERRCVEAIMLARKTSIEGSVRVRIGALRVCAYTPFCTQS